MGNQSKSLTKILALKEISFENIIILLTIMRLNSYYYIYNSNIINSKYSNLISNYSSLISNYSNLISKYSNLTNIKSEFTKLELNFKKKFIIEMILMNCTKEDIELIDPNFIQTIKDLNLITELNLDLSDEIKNNFELLELKTEIITPNEVKSELNTIKKINDLAQIPGKEIQFKNKFNIRYEYILKTMQVNLNKIDDLTKQNYKEYKNIEELKLKLTQIIEDQEFFNLGRVKFMKDCHAKEKLLRDEKSKHIKTEEEIKSNEENTFSDERFYKRNEFCLDELSKKEQSLIIIKKAIEHNIKMS